MSYQAKGLQISLLIHGAVFLMISNTGISESRLSPPMAIDLGIIREVVEEPPPPPEEKKPEEIPKAEEIVPPPQTKIEPVQKKELPVHAKKVPKKIARAEKKESPPPAKQEEVKEQPAPQASDPAPEQPVEDNKILGSAFSEGSAVAPGGSGESSDGEGVEGGTGTSKSGSISGSDEGTSDMTFGSASGPGYRHKEMPVYPSIARRLGREGKVVLRLTIDENGKLVNIEVIEDSGYGFAEAAIAAVKKSSFIPPMMNGKPIRARALLPVKFELR